VPSQLELFVSFGVWALGLLVFTLFMKVAIPIERGEFTHTGLGRPSTAYAIPDSEAQ